MTDAQLVAQVAERFQRLVIKSEPSRGQPGGVEYVAWTEQSLFFPAGKLSACLG
jgi:hypothetical protein